MKAEREREREREVLEKKDGGVETALRQTGPGAAAEQASGSSGCSGVSGSVSGSGQGNSSLTDPEMQGQLCFNKQGSVFPSSPSEPPSPEQAQPPPKSQQAGN